MQRRRVAGLAAVTGILRAADSRTGMQILDNLAAHDRSLAERVGPQPPAFEDLADADDRVLAAVVETAERGVLLTALIGAAPELTARITGRLSPAEAQSARRQLNHPGPIRLRDVEEARQQIARLAQREMLAAPNNLHPVA
jgi:flagellar motor switch protein FliG